MPTMVVVAGPPGGGKSTAFPVSNFSIDFFNADDRAAELNDGSYRGIPSTIRAKVNREFEAFVDSHILAGTSFAIETTLRSDVTFRQADQAKARGFTTLMTYVAMGSLQDHLDRVASRAESGGHAASASALSRIYHASLSNLPDAIRSFDEVQVFDNSTFNAQPTLLLECHKGRVYGVAEAVPDWLLSALRSTEYEITPALREETQKRALDRADHGFER